VLALEMRHFPYCNPAGDIAEHNGATLQPNPG
jgi:hypothetical protein